VCVHHLTGTQGDGGCKKIIIRKGEGWEKPETGDEVSGTIC